MIPAVSSVQNNPGVSAQNQKACDSGIIQKLQLDMYLQYAVWFETQKHWYKLESLIEEPFVGGETCASGSSEFKTF